MKTDKWLVYFSLAVTLVLGACNTSGTTTAPIRVESCRNPEQTGAGTDHSGDLSELLEYQQKARQMNPNALISAIVDLNSHPAQPQELILKAIFYADLGRSGDLQRAQNSLDQLLKSADPKARRYRPMATFLTALFDDRLKLEDTNDRLSQQVRDGQRRLDQVSEKLEALKNIERKLQERQGSNVLKSSEPSISESSNK